jgi:hypothetical protein
MQVFKLNKSIEIKTDVLILNLWPYPFLCNISKVNFGQILNLFFQFSLYAEQKDEFGNIGPTVAIYWGGGG